MKTPRAALLIALTMLALIVSACAGADSAAGPGEIPVGGAPGRDEDTDGVIGPEGGDGLAGEPPVTDEADRSIIKTGEITVEVENVGETSGEVRALALELDGYISNSFQGESEELATLTMRIPAHRFEDAIAAIHDLDGKVKAEATREEDVTAAVVDTEARLTNLRAAEEEYRRLLDQAEKVEDILAIQNQLFQVRGEIEAMEAQLKYLNDQADMSTLTVTIIPVPEPVTAATEDFDPAAIVEQAVASLLGFGQWLVGAGIWFVIVGIPALIVLGIVVFIGYRIVRRFVPTRAKPAAPGSEPPATT